jgi:hypothetical protein
MQVNVLPPVDLTSGGMVSLALNVSCAPVSNRPFEICDNGIDDDGDGLTDSADPDCQSFDCSTGLGCPLGFICNEAAICISHCGDGHWDGDEGDVDCGGSCAAQCQTGQHCWVSLDCASGRCVNHVCQ